MAYPVTAIVNPALKDSVEDSKKNGEKDSESLLFYATQKGQLALQRWPFESSFKTTHFHEYYLWQGPIILPSALASSVQRGLPNVYGFIKRPADGVDDPMIIAQLSPVTQLITPDDQLNTTFSGLAATGDGDKNVFLYYLQNSGPGTAPVIKECTLGSNDPEYSDFSDSVPAPLSRIAAVYLEVDTRLIFFQRANNDIQFIDSSASNPAAFTIPNTGSNAAPNTPLAAVVYGKGDTANIYLYYMSSQKKIIRASMNVGLKKWSTPAERKLKQMSSNTQLCATVSAKENMVFYVENGAKEYNIHRDSRSD